MSEPYSPKKLKAQRTAEIARGAAVPPVAASSTNSSPPGLPVQLADLLCRAHNVPWRQCLLCSPAAKVRP